MSESIADKSGAPATQVNLDSKSAKFKFEAENLETPEDGEHRRSRDVWLFRFALVWVAAVSAMSLWFWATEPPASERFEYAKTLLTALSSGFAGYLVGKKR